MNRLTFAAVSRNYFNMPIWIAKETGLLAEEGIDVGIELYEPIDEVTERLRDGRAQLAFGVTEHVVLDNEAGGDLEIIGGNVNKLPFSLIARKDIRHIEGLRGKTIGVSSIEAGSSSLVMRLLAAHGLEYPRDYALRAVGPILTRWEMLQSGEIDAGLQGVPLNFIAIDQGYPTLCEPRDAFPHFQFTSLNVQARWARENADVLRRFMRAFVRAHAWFYDNPEGATRIAVAQTGIAEAYAMRAWKEYTAEGIFPPDGDVSTPAVQALIEISSLIRALPSRMRSSADAYINRSYLQAAWREVAEQHERASA